MTSILIEILLLMKMEKVIKKYNARFVVNLSELGEDDPLLQNVRPIYLNFNLQMSLPLAI